MKQIEIPIINRNNERKDNGKMKFFIHSGSFDTEDNGLVFHGKNIESKQNGLTYNSILQGIVLFPEHFNEGMLSFDVMFYDICEDTNCGFVLGYNNRNGVTSAYHVGIRNRGFYYGVDRYSGGIFDNLLYGGLDGMIQKNEKISMEIEVRGNSLSFYINHICVFEYVNYYRFSDICGLYVGNNSKAIISNIKIDSKKQTVFSIMKFEKDFDELYQEVIVPLCDEYGYESIRADECYTSSSIIQDIIREISNASIIIADITMDNPNVFYELGYAHALSKPTILLADTDKRERLPFDVSGYRTIFYKNTIGGKKEIENTLRKYINNIQAK